MLLPRLKNDTVPELKLNLLQKATKDQVSNKVNTKIYLFEEINCPICESQQKEIVGQKDRYGLFFTTNICTDCGLVYTNPRMTQESYNLFYNLEYRKLYVGQETASQDFFESQKRKGKRIYDFLEQQQFISQEPLFVFEVGCGAGGILDFFKEKGHTVKGIDIGEEYVNYGKQTYGLDLDTGFLSTYPLDKTPDIIIYSHVLEHVLDLNNELQAIKKYANENTLIYIEVPGIKEIHKNYESNILKYFQNAHTFHFTLESLTNLFVKNGFKLVSGNQFVQSVFKHTASPLTIQNDYKQTREYILHTENKRKFYPFTIQGIKSNAQKGLLTFLNKTNTRKIAKSAKRWITKHRRYYPPTFTIKNHS